MYSSIINRTLTEIEENPLAAFPISDRRVGRMSRELSVSLCTENGVRELIEKLHSLVCASS